MPDTRPRITFKEGVCNSCQILDETKLRESRVDYQKRDEEFKELLERIKKESENSSHPYDCIVPWSGGKDSSSVALRLKNEYNITPLLVTFNPLIPTDVGEHNKKALLENGFDSIEIKADRRVSKLLSRRFLIERGNPKLHWDAGVNAGIFRTALITGIKYIFFAEHGETHYGGRILSRDSERIRSYEEVIENQIGDSPENWIEKGIISHKDLFPYLMPYEDEIKKAGIEAHYFGYYKKWNIVENFRYVKKEIDFRTCKRGRTYGTVTNFDSLDDYMDDLYYYLQFIKFGFGRAIRDLSRQIQKGEIQRSEALPLAKKYDGEYPSDSMTHIIKYLNLSEKEIKKILDSHRSSNIWLKKEGIWENKLSKLIC